MQEVVELLREIHETLKFGNLLCAATFFIVGTFVGLTLIRKK